MRGRGGPLPSVARPVPHAAQAQSHPRGEHGRSLSQWHRRYLCDGAAGCGRCPSRPCPAAWTNVSREVGGLSPSTRRRQTASPRTRGKWPPERSGIKSGENGIRTRSTGGKDGVSRRMCGIYGMVGADAESVRPRMGAARVHRGPDGDGWGVRGAGGVGCRRLAIIDVAGGAQPLANETGDVIAVCNGEIYNSAPLRSALQSRGHRFRTHSDAEVLPHLYEDEGIDFVHALDGMFGLALWDARRGRLVLARDRMGENPRYHATTPAGCLFASEPNALLASGRVGREPDWAALAAYLRTGYVPNPASAFAAVQKLPPGGRLVLVGESVRADRYWEVAPFLAGPPLPLGLDEAADQLRAHLVRAVRAALVSDVPLGVFLSGGLDSTAITAVTRSVGGELNTFALGFAERGFDERDHAALAARALGTRHRTLTITPSLFLEGVRDLAPLIDEPLADPAWVPTFLLARFARTHVKTVLVGEGADELFAGYPTYLGGALAARYARLPAGVRRALAAAAPALGAPQGNTTVRYLLRRFLEEGDRPAAARHRAWTGCIDAARLARLATPGGPDRKSTRLNSSHSSISYAVFCLKKKNNIEASGAKRVETRYSGRAVCGRVHFFHGPRADRLCASCGVYLDFFFFNDTATTEIYTLSLHDALPIRT